VVDLAGRDAVPICLHATPSRASRFSLAGLPGPVLASPRALAGHRQLDLTDPGLPRLCRSRFVVVRALPLRPPLGRRRCWRAISASMISAGSSPLSRRKSECSSIRALATTPALVLLWSLGHRVLPFVSRLAGSNRRVWGPRGRELLSGPYRAVTPLLARDRRPAPKTPR